MLCLSKVTRAPRRLLVLPRIKHSESGRMEWPYDDPTAMRFGRGGAGWAMRCEQVGSVLTSRKIQLRVALSSPGLVGRHDSLSCSGPAKPSPRSASRSSSAMPATRPRPTIQSGIPPRRVPCWKGAGFEIETRSNLDFACMRWAQRKLGLRSAAFGSTSFTDEVADNGVLNEKMRPILSRAGGRTNGT